MPAVVLVAAVVIAAGAAIYSSYTGGKSADRATRAQAEAAANALKFEREKEAAKRAEYDKAMEKYKLQYAAWQARRNKLLEHYGVKVPPTNTPPTNTTPPPTTPTPPTTPPVPTPPVQTPPPTQNVPPVQTPLPTQSMVTSGAGQNGQNLVTGNTLADLMRTRNQMSNWKA